MPVTIPEVFTVAIEDVPVLHTPPLTDSVKVLVAPAHMLEEPVIDPATGVRLTVIADVAVAVPQPLATT